MPKRYNTKRYTYNVRNKTSKKCLYPSTTQGLIKWYTHLFEKLGWIVLANKQGMKFKVDTYKKSITVLEEKLICKINMVNDPDKRNDLIIILNNVNILHNRVKRDFN